MNWLRKSWAWLIAAAGTLSPVVSVQVGSQVSGQLREGADMMSPEAIVLALGFSAATGIFFGYYPARKAMSLLPIQALRHE